MRRQSVGHLDLVQADSPHRRRCVLDPVPLRQQAAARWKFSAIEGVVLPEWIDANGHLNLAYYVVLFDQATDLLYDDAGRRSRRIAMRPATRPSPPRRTRCTEREVRVGERVRVVPHLLGADAKRLHYFHEMFHADGGHRVASAGTDGAAYRHVGAPRGAVSGGSVRAAAAGGAGARRPAAAEGCGTTDRHARP